MNVPLPVHAIRTEEYSCDIPESARYYSIRRPLATMPRVPGQCDRILEVGERSLAASRFGAHASSRSGRIAETEEVPLLPESR